VFQVTEYLVDEVVSDTSADEMVLTAAPVPVAICVAMGAALAVAAVLVS